MTDCLGQIHQIKRIMWFFPPSLSLWFRGTRWVFCRKSGAPCWSAAQMIWTQFVGEFSLFMFSSARHLYLPFGCLCWQYVDGVQCCIYDVYTVHNLQLNGAALAQKALTYVCPPTYWGIGRAVFASLCLESMFVQRVPRGLSVCDWHNL